MHTHCKIGSHHIGHPHPCFIIAEAGVNHNGDIMLARQLIDAAAAAGADAVKFQTFRTERLVTTAAPKAAYQQQTTGATESQATMLQRLELSTEDHRTLAACAAARGILFLSTPFDEESATFLVEMGVSAIKLSSGDVTNLPLLRHVAGLGKPVILSTGMAYLSEVDEAVRTLQTAGCVDLILLQCVTNYPAAAADSNLRVMQTLAQAFGTMVGYSDHTIGNAVPLAAVALGACMIEKHLTLDRALDGPDHQASTTPDALRELVQDIRTIESALGTGVKVPTPSEQPIALVARRSLYLRDDLAAGAPVTWDALIALRPGDGIPPGLAHLVVGRQAACTLSAGTRLQWGDLR